MIRRQMVRPMRRPLIVMTPKSLLRHRLAVSTLEDLADGKFEPVLGEIEEKIDNVAIVRVEQLYPFPYEEMRDIVKTYPNAKQIVWCQEEPRNQGAWRATRHQRWVMQICTLKNRLRWWPKHWPFRKTVNTPVWLNINNRQS